MKTDTTADLWLVHLRCATEEDEDDNSWSSTVAFDSIEFPFKTTMLSTVQPLDNQQEGRRRRQRQRQVQFDESANVNHENTLYSQEESQKLWYNNQEYHNFRTTTSNLIQMIDQTEGGGTVRPQSQKNKSTSNARYKMSYISILEDSYRACGQRPALDLDDGDEDDNDCGLLTPGTTTRIEKVRLRQLFLTELGLARLGLERRSVRFLVKERRRLRDALMCVVSFADDLGYNYDADAAAEELRQKCRRITYPSRMFARRLAQAQLLAEC